MTPLPPVASTLPGTPPGRPRRRDRLPAAPLTAGRGPGPIRLAAGACRGGPGREGDVETTVTQKTVLHVGCGQYSPEKLHPHFRGPGWQEVRLDIDPGVKPDIVCSITDMSAVPSESVD